MNNQTHQTVLQTIIEVLGVDEADVTPNAEFILDLNATPTEIATIKAHLEEKLDTILPDFEPNQPLTVSDLIDIADDSVL